MLSEQTNCDSIPEAGSGCMAEQPVADDVVDDSISVSSSSSSDFCVVADLNQPRRSSVDSGQVVAEMSEVLAGLTDRKCP